MTTRSKKKGGDKKNEGSPERSTAKFGQFPPWAHAQHPQRRNLQEGRSCQQRLVGKQRGQPGVLETTDPFWRCPSWKPGSFFWASVCPPVSGFHPCFGAVLCHGKTRRKATHVGPSHRKNPPHSDGDQKVQLGWFHDNRCLYLRVRHHIFWNKYDGSFLQFGSPCCILVKGKLRQAKPHIWGGPTSRSLRNPEGWKKQFLQQGNPPQ